MKILVILHLLVLFYYIPLLLWHFYILILSFPTVLKMHREDIHGNINYLMQQTDIPITIIMAAFNEESTIVDAVYSVLRNNYKNVQIFIVNDGSTDNTLEFLINEFSLYIVPNVINQQLETDEIKTCYLSKSHPNIFVFDKVHSKYNNAAACHNLSLNAIFTPIIMTLDSDTVIEEDAISKALYGFLSNTHCLAIGGSIFILNGNKVNKGKILTKNIPGKLIPSFQTIEYLRAFTYGRAGLNQMGGALTYPGAFTLFETKAVKDFGGFDTENVSFDTEITLRLHSRMRELNYPTFIEFNTNAIGWTDVPETFRQYWNQRAMWQRGILQSIGKHKKMFCNPKYGIVGLVSFPAFILFEVYGPVVEFFLYLVFLVLVILGITSFKILFWYILWAWSSLILLTLGSLFLSLMTVNIFHKFSDTMKLIFLVTLEMFGFRQFRSTCCAWATVKYFWHGAIKKKN